MDHYSILDHGDAPATNPAIVSGAATARPAGSSISTQIAAANAKLAGLAEGANAESMGTPRFPGEDCGRSLAELAEADLDATLQLLAERAVYITGASAAAIALRRDRHNDMLCRATVGENAPELGALLSMEHGLSGESVRSRQPLRCDDAGRDPRVNHEVCRELGIASVLVLPIFSEEFSGEESSGEKSSGEDHRRVLGVFELFSGQPRAFGERDVSALLRLGQMVETAFRHASAVQSGPAFLPNELSANTEAPERIAAPAIKPLIEVETLVEEPAKHEKSPTIPRKPLFWSAAMRTQTNARIDASSDVHSDAHAKNRIERSDESTAAVPVPPVLRNLQKCQSCGFPVSTGRTFCVDCEEKKWRGQRVEKPTAAQLSAAPASALTEAIIEPDKPLQATFIADAVIPAISPQPAVAPPPAAKAEPPASEEIIADRPVAFAPEATADVIAAPTNAEDATPLFGSALPAQSWLSSNKFILIALFVIAAGIAAVVWLR